MSKIFNFQFTISNYIKFLWKKPKVVIITGDGRKAAFEAVSKALKQYFKIGKEILIFESDLKSSEELEKFKKLVKKSEKPIIIATHTNEIPKDTIFFPSDQNKLIKIRELVRALPIEGYLILNSDDEGVKDLGKESVAKFLAFGFSERADFMASDLKINDETNFKINYNGNSVPLWLEKSAGKEQIYSALAAAAVGTINNLNLVEISQALKIVDVGNKLS
jgi:UDP-N-acetylmuramate-alanine ligase